MFTLGGAGMIILDQTHNPTTPKFNRLMLQFVVSKKWRGKIASSRVVCVSNTFYF